MMRTYSYPQVRKGSYANSAAVLLNRFEPR